MNIQPVQLFKALSDDTRLKCLLLIAHETELCVCELTSALQDIQPKVSRHLAQLRATGLLVDRRQGQWVYYALNPELPIWIKKVVDQTLEQNLDYIAENLRQLNHMGDRPVRQQKCCS